MCFRLHLFATELADKSRDYKEGQVQSKKRKVLA